MKITKVYTRTGDKGMTDLVGGVRISKTDPRLEAYGTTDELSSHLGLLAAMMANDEHPLEEERQMLVRCQNNLFIIGSYLAIDQSQTPLYDFAKLPDGETTLLEERIDQLMATLPEKQGFVLPGGTVSAAQCHVCRTVCRRAERRILELAQHDHVDDYIPQYVNRLSDYLFVLAKIINFNAGQSENLWQNTCR
ncbi:MAG: cob(I)yrinic acid a,c-diamide adenosyltransferase [Prevotella sp.]|nr:cob(I)yrinic acid a,c-diamide adenosyltransferase [Prevotella sp.]